MAGTSGNPESHDPAAASPRIRVLLVDDRESDRHLMTRFLAHLGFNVTAVAGVKEALESCRDNPPDVILADWCLGVSHASGLDLLKTLRSQQSTKRLPFVMISGVRDGEEDDARVRREGGDLFVTRSDILCDERRREEFVRRLRALALAGRGVDGAPQVEPPQATRVSEKNIFVIDDDLDIQELVRVSLAMRYPRLHFFTAGEEGFLRALEHQPDLVLLDLSMPGMNGVAAHSLFRGHEKTRGIPIMVMTGMPDQSNVVKSLVEKLGADDFLRKPFGTNELIQRVDRLLRAAASPPRHEAPRPAVLERGRFRVDTGLRRVWVSGRPVEKDLGPKRFDLLCELLSRPGPVSRKELRAALWSDRESCKIVEINIRRLRLDLGLARGEAIVSVPGGYHLVG